MGRNLPNPDISLSEAADFILDGPLGRKALSTANPPPQFSLFLRDTIKHIYRLGQSCHLAEFTDHSVHHLCSLVDRVNTWTMDAGGTPKDLVGALSEYQSGVLLVAILTHDIGMLSQKAEDLDEDKRLSHQKGEEDTARWVRRTHIWRISGLLRRLHDGHPILKDRMLADAIDVAKAHGSWPWQDLFARLGKSEKALAAILAVVDLLDEDSNRCDTHTLLHHREGTPDNRAHWIRHSLTHNRVKVAASTIEVELRRPPRTGSPMEPVFSALRNQYRLTALYNDALAAVGAPLNPPYFNFASGIPSEECENLDDWSSIPEMGTEPALVGHLLLSMFPEARRDPGKVDQDTSSRVDAILGVETVDLSILRTMHSAYEFDLSDEKCFKALLIS